MNKEDFSGLWDRMKENEEPIDMEISIVDYDILGDGNVAIVHFTSLETFKWIGDETPDGKKPGDIYSGVARWSDVLVKEGDRWLCIGGHRDHSGSEKGLEKIN